MENEARIACASVPVAGQGTGESHMRGGTGGRGVDCVRRGPRWAASQYVVAHDASYGIFCLDLSMQMQCPVLSGSKMDPQLEATGMLWRRWMRSQAEHQCSPNAAHAPTTTGRDSRDKGRELNSAVILLAASTRRTTGTVCLYPMRFQSYRTWMTLDM